MAHEQSDATGETPLRFEQGLGLLVGFVVFIAGFLIAWQGFVSPALRRLVGLSANDPWGVVLTVVPGAISLGIGWRVLRFEGVHLRDIGLSWNHLKAGLLWFLGVVVTLNVLLVLVTIGIGGSLGRSYADMSFLLIVANATITWIFVGIAEELVARAYVQNKLVALLGGSRSLLRKTLAIVVAATVFGLWHIPQRLVAGELAPSQLSTNLLLLLGAGLVFGVIYELTRNVVFTGLIHGAYDFAPVAFSVHYETQSMFLQVLLISAILGPFLVGIWTYHRWARNRRSPDFRPPVAA